MPKVQRYIVSTENSFHSLSMRPDILLLPYTLNNSQFSLFFLTGGFHSLIPMQQCNHLPGQVFFTEHSTLDLYSELCCLETKSRNDGFSQISGTLPAISKFSGNWGIYSEVVIIFTKVHIYWLLSNVCGTNVKCKFLCVTFYILIFVFFGFVYWNVYS
jgi:hypothetical protein